LRTSLKLTAGDAEHEGAAFQFAAIPAGYPQINSFDFDAPSIQALFQFGYRCAQAGRLWTASPRDEQNNASGNDDGAGRPNQCPADAQGTQRLAIR